MSSDTFKRIENLHIIFWLVKDTCWMLELKWLGAAMMLPTLGLAIYFIYKTFYSIDLYLNAAIFFWILANSYWMMAEFFNDGAQKELAILPFSLGIVMVLTLYWKNYQLRKKALR
ncbi:MAG: hypothetical protein V4635_03230 [Bacteroidota bacterium]